MADDLRDARDLERFIGDWEVTVDLPAAAGLAGRSTFEWLLGRRFLVQRSSADHPDVPSAYMVVTADHRRDDGYLQHYFDSRGVVRLYEMDVDGAVWVLTRLAPDFSALDFAQRWIGSFSEDGDTIEGRWETSPDGREWQLDFRLTYRRIREEGQG
jgi:hypothetical protein